jgi:hypothetical protein
MTLQLIDEVIGYAKANAEAAETADQRRVWEAHQRNCVAVRAEIERLQDAKRRALAIADERAKEANALRAACLGMDRLALVIESAVRNADPRLSNDVIAAIKATRAALEQKAGK